MHNLLKHTWTDWKVGLVISFGATLAAGLLAAWLTPRGPMTTIQALLSIGVGFTFGILIGVITGSRWSIFITPVVFLIIFELARLGVDGPLVDGIYLNSFYGIIAFVLGRVLHGILVLLPMFLGGVYGVWISERLGKETSNPLGAAAWIFTIPGTLLLIGITIFLARPASTAPIVGVDGQPLPGSIAELTSVPIGGHDQALMIRGRNTNNPVLLFLAGGPGGTEFGAMRADTGLEENFVVVTWDQRGAGKSYAALDPVETLTLDQMIADTIELTNYLRERFNEEKIYLVGQSWGTTLGTLAVQKHPELYHAYVGCGQMVSLKETDIMFYQDTLTWAEDTGNDSLAAKLLENGPPPYDNMLDYEPAASHEHDWNAYPTFDSRNEMPAILFVPEYSWMERLNGFRGFLDTFSVIYPQLQDIDFRQDIPVLEIPYYMVIGKYEARGRAKLAEEWFKLLEAPNKERIVFETSGHRPNFEQPEKFALLMSRVLEETYLGK